MRIVHIADVHLDRPFVGLPRAAAKTRRAGLFSTFRRCIELAEERGADLFTIGGDLWEEEHVTPDTRRSVAHELGRLGTPVLIVCGNHDRLQPGGSYAQTDWPANVHVFPQRSFTTFDIQDGVVWGVSWGSRDLAANLLDKSDVPDDGRHHILLVHGTAVPLLDLVDEAYFPFQPAKVRDAGFSICLAGHVHVAAEEGPVVYPGSPEPLGWGEQGRHCAAVVELTGESVSVDLVEVNETRYETREADCTGCGSSAEVRRRLKDALDDQNRANLFLRLRLVGEVDPQCELEATRLEAELGGSYGALVVEDRTVPLLELAERASGHGLEGLFVQTLLERIEQARGEGERRELELALTAGLRAIEGREPILHVD